MERHSLPRARALAALLGLLLALIASPPAHAATTLPGDELFIRLVDPPAGSAVAGVQLQGCADAACQVPLLLLARGVCSGPACLPGAAAYGAGLYPPNDGARRLSLSLPDDALAGNPIDAHPLRRVVVQLDRTAYASDVFAPERRGYYLAEFADGRIALRPYAEFPPRLASQEGPLLHLILFLIATLVAKPAVAAAIARLRGAPSPYEVASLALPAALVSTPLVWGVFPAFSPFATPADLGAAWLSLAFVAAFSLGALALANLGRLRPLQIGAAVVSLAPLLCVWLAGADERLRAVDLPRLPWLSANPWLNLIVVFTAVALLEGWLLRHTLRGRLSPRDSIAVAVAMNLAVAAIGLVALAPALYA